MDCSLQGSSVCGIFQARILGWVAISSSRRSSWLRDWTCVSCIVSEFFTLEPPGKTQCVFISMQIASDSFHFFPTPASASYNSLQITGWWQRPVGVHPTLFCGPANISPPNCHPSLWFRDEELKWKKWKQLGGCSHFVWKINQCPVSNFLGWEPKELTSKSSVSTPGSRGDAPLAVSSNHTCILFPGLQLGGDAVTRSLSGCKALDVKRSIRPGWTALGVCAWPGDFPSSCTRAHLCSALGTDRQDPSLGTSMRNWSPPGCELAAPIPGQQTIAGKGKGSHHAPRTVVKNSLADPRDTASIPGSGRSPGVGNGNLLQCSCLENPTDRGVWWAIVPGVTRVGHTCVTKQTHCIC